MRQASVDASADEALAKMGYKSELPRHLSMMSILGLYVSFSRLVFLLSVFIFCWLLRCTVYTTAC